MCAAIDTQWRAIGPIIRKLNSPPNRGLPIRGNAPVRVGGSVCQSREGHSRVPLPPWAPPETHPPAGMPMPGRPAPYFELVSLGQPFDPVAQSTDRVGSRFPPPGACDCRTRRPEWHFRSIVRRPLVHVNEVGRRDVTTGASAAVGCGGCGGGGGNGLSDRRRQCRATTAAAAAELAPPRAPRGHPNGPVSVHVRCVAKRP